MRRRWAILVLLSSIPATAADPLLDRAKHNATERFATTPNFTCLLDIERTVYPTATSRRFLSRNRTRLEVSVVNGRELFAWPGEAFEERSLIDFLGQGLSSTGEFSSHGGTVFMDTRTEIERVAEQPSPKRVVYRYRVPVEASRYAIYTADRPLVTAYEGVFHVDPASAQVLRFEVNAPHPPPASGLARIAAAIDYAQVEVGGAPAWLPAEAEIEAQPFDGPVARNRLTFRSCRSFQAQSAISFGGTEAADAGGESAVELVAVPPGLKLPLELREAISSDRAWAGDPIAFVLYKNVKSGGETLLPKGAEVQGRVVRIETIDRTPSAAAKDKVVRLTEITLRLSEVRWAGHCAPLSATLGIVERMPQMARVDPAGHAVLSPSAYSANRASAYETAEGLSDIGSGIFIVYGELYLVRVGTRMRWITEAAPPSGSKASRPGCGQSNPNVEVVR